MPHCIIDGRSGHGTAAQASSTGPSVIQLVNASSRLPDTVPIAVESDPIARFRGSPNDLVPDGEDAWEYLDVVLNNFIGYGMSVEEVIPLIRRGEFGMNGLCNWLNECVTSLGVPEVLLEGKLKRLLDACERYDIIISMHADIDT